MKKTLTFLLLSIIKSSTQNDIENTTLSFIEEFYFTFDEASALDVVYQTTSPEENGQTSPITITSSIEQNENISKPIVVNEIEEISAPQVDLNEQFQRLTIKDEKDRKNINDKRLKTMVGVSEKTLFHKRSKNRYLKKSIPKILEKNERKKLLINEVEKRKLKRQKRDLKMQEQNDLNKILL